MAGRYLKQKQKWHQKKNQRSDFLNFFFGGKFLKKENTFLCGLHQIMIQEITLKLFNLKNKYVLMFTILNYKEFSNVDRNLIMSATVTKYPFPVTALAQCGLDLPMTPLVRNYFLLFYGIPQKLYKPFVLSP